MKNTYLLKIINEDRQVLIEKMFHNLENVLNEVNCNFRECEQGSKVTIEILQDISLRKRLRYIIK